MVRSGLFALAGQPSRKTLSGLVFYHCVREGVPGDSGPGEEGEFKLVCFRLGDLKTFFIVSDIGRQISVSFKFVGRRFDCLN